jgi:hypothetical protein
MSGWGIAINPTATPTGVLTFIAGLVIAEVRSASDRGASTTAISICQLAKTAGADGAASHAMVFIGALTVTATIWTITELKSVEFSQPCGRHLQRLAVRRDPAES